MGGSAPPGATALCRDGTYSYSQHHSGTCSHHGGVAEWLDGSTTSPPPPPPASQPSSGAIDVGTTVYLGKVTKSSGCTLGPEPDAACSPGAYYSKLTKKVLCAPVFTTKKIRNVPDSVKHAIEQHYGLPARSYGNTLEIDHIVSLELGGSNDPANLFPEKVDANPGYRVKDRLENKLHQLVCAGKLYFPTVQKQIAKDWESLYKKVYGTNP